VRPLGILAPSLVVTSVVLAAGCSRTPPSGDPQSLGNKPDAAAAAMPSASVAPAVNAAGPPANATPCTSAGGPACYRFAKVEDAFSWVIAKDPLILAVGEAHAQKGTESIVSSTKRFSETLLPLVAPKSSDVVVELWAPDPKCRQEVQKVASVQKQVTEVQASGNQNEYLGLGTKARAVGMTPWLLRPTCDDFSMLADAGADAIDKMLGLVKRLTQTKIEELIAKQRKLGVSKTVIAYGGALHNDLAPSPAMKDYTFGPELDRLVSGRYIELDLIVPEFVKKSATWEKLPWFPSFEADRAPASPTGGAARENVTLYATGDKSFVLIFPETPAGAKAKAAPP
jgi:hypothetical protein